MSVPYLWIEDQAGNRCDLPADFWLRDDGWSQTANVQHVAFGMGGRDLADGHLEHRVITIEGAVRADTLAALEVKVRAVQKALVAAGKLHVSDDVVPRFIVVANPKVDSQYSGEYRFEKIINVSFVCPDPFWMSDHEYGAETGEYNLLSGNDSFKVDNSASDSIVYPLIRIVADVADLPSVKLTNKTDGGMSFEYNEPDFRVGDYLDIDSYYGTVKRNGNDEMAHFSPANFLRLQPSVNDFTYEGAACTVLVVYRRVYL